MPIFLNAVVQLNNAPLLQKWFFPIAVQTGLMRWAEGEATEPEQQAMFIELLIHHQRRRVYQWLPALRQFYVSVKWTIIDEYQVQEQDAWQIISQVERLTNYTDCDQRMVLCYLLMKADLFTPVNQSMVQRHSKPYFLARSFYLLRESGLLNQVTCQFLLTNNHIIDVMHAIIAMKQVSLCDRANLDRLMRRHQQGLGYIFRILVLFDAASFSETLFSRLLFFSKQSIIGIATDLSTLADRKALFATHVRYLMSIGHIADYDAKTPVIMVLETRGMLTTDVVLPLLNVHNNSKPLLFLLNELSSSVCSTRVFTEILTRQAGAQVECLLRTIRDQSVLNKTVIRSFIRQLHAMDCVRVFDGLKRVDARMLTHDFLTLFVQTPKTSEQLQAWHWKLAVLRSVKKVNKDYALLVSMYPKRHPDKKKRMQDAEGHQDRLFFILKCIIGMQHRESGTAALGRKKPYSIDPKTFAWVMNYAHPMHLAERLERWCLKEHSFDQPLTPLDLKTILNSTPILEENLSEEEQFEEGLSEHYGSSSALFEI